VHGPSEHAAAIAVRALHLPRHRSDALIVYRAAVLAEENNASGDE
jgi:hypothetical protein